MVISDNFYPTIHITLKRLIEEKAKRDNINFTAYQLAQALDMPRSIIAKLTHIEKEKRVINPRIETLLKIVDFFRADGFNITLDDLIGSKSTSVEISSQQIVSEQNFSISIYSLESKKHEEIGTIEIKMPRKNKNVFGLISDQDTAPFFKAGSIFIVDPDIPLEHDHLIALRLQDSDKLEIRKYCVDKTKIILAALDNPQKSIILMPTVRCEILGVIIQINAKT